MLANIIEESLKKSYSYSEYIELIDSLLAQNKTTGEDHSESMLNYSKLNRQRMKRLDKTISIDEEQQLFFKNLQRKEIWLIISEAWCADASQIVPILHKIAEINSNICLKIVLRDENEALMNQMVEEYKAIHGKLTPEFKEQLQKWYNEDKGVSIINDLKEIIKF